MESDQELSKKAAEIAISETHRMMSEIGLTRPYYLSKLLQLCECTKPISCIKGKEADGGTVDFVDVPDNRVQLDSIKTVIALYGDEAPKHVAVDIEGSLMAAVAAQLAGGKVDKPVDNSTYQPPEKKKRR